MCSCVWSRDLVNEEAMANWRVVTSKTNKLFFSYFFLWYVVMKFTSYNWYHKYLSGLVQVSSHPVLLNYISHTGVGTIQQPLSNKNAALLVGRSRDRFPVVLLVIFSVVPPTEPCVPRKTQPLKVSTRDFSWSKDGQYVWLTTYHPCSAETSRKSRALIYPEPLGPPRPVAGWPLLLLLPD